MDGRQRIHILRELNGEYEFSSASPLEFANTFGTDANLKRKSKEYFWRIMVKQLVWQAESKSLLGD